MDKGGGASLLSFPPQTLSQTCLPAQTWACLTPAALAKPPEQSCALAGTKSPDGTSSSQRHGHKGKGNEYFLASVAHTTPVLPAWLGRGIQCSHHIQHCSQPNPVPCHYPPPSLPPYQELSFFHFTISDFFFRVHSQSVLLLPVPFKEHNAGSLLHRI